MAAGAAPIAGIVLQEVVIYQGEDLVGKIVVVAWHGGKLFRWVRAGGIFVS